LKGELIKFKSNWDKNRIQEIETQIEKFNETTTLIKHANKNVINTPEILNDIFDKGITNAHLKYLVKEIRLSEITKEEFDIEVDLNTPFSNHYKTPYKFGTEGEVRMIDYSYCIS